MLKTFKRGVHPPESKYTASDPLSEFETPDRVFVSLAQSAGAPCEPVVKEGDKVKAGTLIGRAKGFVSANVFSSVSGEVKGFVKRPSSNGFKVMHVEIENDFKYETESLPPLLERTPAALLERVKQAGIVGMGGAGFPAHVKLMPKKRVDTLIINGAECEPYITCDYRLMLEKGQEIINGIKYTAQILGVGEAYIGIESNKKDAIKKLAQICPPEIKVVALKSKYPQGAEKQLIYSVTKRVVPAGGLPMDAGCVVVNVHTAYSIARAIDNGEPCYMRAMTVSGDGIEKGGNFWVRGGIPYSFIYEKTRGNIDEEKVKKVIVGGPMMGIAQSSLLPVTGKTCSSLLFLTAKNVNSLKPTQCINCGRCMRGCPMNLNPKAIEENTLADNTDKLKNLDVFSCIECGVCSFACPAKRPLLFAVRLAKKTLKERGIK